jgi:hypothetical protein
MMNETQSRQLRETALNTTASDSSAEYHPFEQHGNIILLLFLMR